MRVSSVDVTVTNPDKVLFPGDGVTKRELADYYRRVADRMLPYLRDRPLAMARYPDGITGERIFQKNLPDHAPAWVRRVEVGKQDGTVRHAVADIPATLVYLANLACIEPHVFLSRTDRLDRPDQLVIDLDPPGGAGFPDARHAALRLRAMLTDELGLACYVRTTGGDGLHVHVPLNRRADFDTVRRLARGVAVLLAARHPRLVTTEQRRHARRGRVYVDVMRNAFAQTVIAPYAVRARPGAPVATPLHWAEAEDPRLSPARFTLRTVPDRFNTTTDPWADMGRRRYDAAVALRRLDRLVAPRPR